MKEYNFQMEFLFIDLAVAKIKNHKRNWNKAISTIWKVMQNKSKIQISRFNFHSDLKKFFAEQKGFFKLKLKI